MRMKVIKDYPDYSITENGEIYSNKYKETRKLKNHYTPQGYLRIGLCKNGKQKHFLVHDLVALTYIPNPDNKPFVNHKDEDKTNNRVDNLEWCTSKENNRHGTRLTRIAESNKIAILQLDKLGRIIKRWDSQTDAGRELGLDKRNINACLKGRRKLCGGYKWRYVNE